jgi:histidinol phosphatase-like PHP family hydrolase
VTIDKDVQKAQIKGILRIAITDHGSVKKPEWICDYFSEIEKWRKISKLDILTGIECDISADGLPVVSETIIGDMDVVIGALHKLPELSDPIDVQNSYLKIVSSAIEKKWMRILAHPTDVGWVKLQLSSKVVEEISRIAAKNGVTLELNFHHRDPNPTNLQIFLKNGASITATSDAHELNEIGNYYWHKSIIMKSGFKGEIHWMEI